MQLLPIPTVNSITPIPKELGVPLVGGHQLVESMSEAAPAPLVTNTPCPVQAELHVP